MKDQKFKYVFGPVPSRRLGRSLGIDLAPFKTCTYDCIYCQLGRTTIKTSTRKEYVPLKDILAELDHKLESGASPDYITLSGSGEPTLHSEVGSLISEVKAKTNIPLAVLTNGSLLWNRNVRNALLEADLVIPSLDAAGPTTFSYVNRPHEDITFDKLIEGLAAFRGEFLNKIWLEVFLLGGVTGIQPQVERIASIAEKIHPDKVQLNTVVRPPAEEFAYAVPHDRMEMFAEMFGGTAEVIADYDSVHDREDFSATRQDVLSLLERRPCSIDDVAQGLAIHRNEVLKYLEQLVKENVVTTETNNGSVFYAAGSLKRQGSK